MKWPSILTVKDEWEFSGEGVRKMKMCGKEQNQSVTCNWRRIIRGVVNTPDR